MACGEETPLVLVNLTNMWIVVGNDERMTPKEVTYCNTYTLEKWKVVTK
jgi:hypothetical protein